MINQILAQELNKYSLTNLEDIKNTLREVAQKIILSGLSRGKIFEHVAFYGGTSLRLLHHLERFSEDLDFTLIHDCEDFSLEKYLTFAVKELQIYGLDASSVVKDKTIKTSVITGYVKFNLQDAIDSCFPKKNIKVNKEENVSIKVEVETNYYPDFEIEYKTLLFPNYFKVKTFTFSTLFSCKLLAVLNRNWKTRVKGRDYYDFLFYITNEVIPNYVFLKNALNLDEMNRDILYVMLKDKFLETDFALAKKDVVPFIQTGDRFIELFDKEVFMDILNELK